jgi:hypothetical protein
VGESVELGSLLEERATSCGRKARPSTRAVRDASAHSQLRAMSAWMLLRRRTYHPVRLNSHTCSLSYCRLCVRYSIEPFLRRMRSAARARCIFMPLVQVLRLKQRLLAESRRRIILLCAWFCASARSFPSSVSCTSHWNTASWRATLRPTHGLFQKWREPSATLRVQVKAERHCHHPRDASKPGSAVY